MRGGGSTPTDLRPSPVTPPYHKKRRMFLSKTKGRTPTLKLAPRPGRSGYYSPRCFILCVVVALMCSRARGGRPSITRWISASVSRTSTRSSAYCASLASPSRLFAFPYRPPRSFCWGPVHPEGCPGLYALRPSFAPRSGGREDCYRELRRIPIPRTPVNKGAARGPRRRGSGKLYLRDQERQQETRSRGEGDPRAAFPVGVGHERVGKRGEHRASSEGEQHRQRPLPRSRECDIAKHYSGG